MLKEYLNYLQKQDKEDKKDESAGSSSTFDPFGGPCAQDPTDF